MGLKIKILYPIGRQYLMDRLHKIQNNKNVMPILKTKTDAGVEEINRKNQSLPINQKHDKKCPYFIQQVLGSTRTHAKDQKLNLETLLKMFILYPIGIMCARTYDYKLEIKNQN